MVFNQTLEARNTGCERGGYRLFGPLSFTITGGDLVQITGGNGTGKTTLLRMLCGMLPADNGEILLDGRPLAQARESFNQLLLWAGHLPGINPRLTALENLHFYYPDVPARQRLSALAATGLAGYEDLPAARLSAGQQRRVALSRLWLTRAALWILDEPFTALDAQGVTRLSQRMVRHARQGGGVIFTTHQPLPAGTLPLRRIALGSEGYAT